MELPDIPTDPAQLLPHITLILPQLEAYREALDRWVDGVDSYSFKWIDIHTDDHEQYDKFTKAVKKVKPDYLAKSSDTREPTLERLVEMQELALEWAKLEFQYAIVIPSSKTRLYN